MLRPIGTKGERAIALANGINPEYGKLDAYHMAWSVIDEAIRNAVAVGADPARIAFLDNFCWGDPKRPETLGALVEAARGCHDAAIASTGSLYLRQKIRSTTNTWAATASGRMTYPPGCNHSPGCTHPPIHPSELLISSIGLLEDWSQAMTMDLKTPGSISTWLAITSLPGAAATWP